MFLAPRRGDMTQLAESCKQSLVAALRPSPGEQGGASRISRNLDDRLPSVNASEVNPHRLHRALRTALQKLYREDALLLIDRTHERSVMFHVARRLVSSVDRWNEGWHVDTDYNRSSDAVESERVKKYLPDSSREPDALGRRRREVLPDLIVHRRLSPGAPQDAEANLLVLECKWGASGREEDLQKLRGYQAVFGYRSAAYLELSARNPLQAPKLLLCDATGPSSGALDIPGAAPRPMW